MFFAQLGVSIPVFWMGMLLIIGLSVNLGWFPSFGRGAVQTARGNHHFRPLFLDYVHVGRRPVVLHGYGETANEAKREAE